MPQQTGRLLRATHNVTVRVATIATPAPLIKPIEDDIEKKFCQ
jgi:hypothetical protein